MPSQQRPTEAASLELPCTIADEDIERIRQEADSKLERWNQLGRFWSITHYTAGLAGAGFTVSGAVLSAADLWQEFGIGLSIVSAVLFAFVAFINPAKAARDYRAAWRQLEERRLEDIACRTQRSTHDLRTAIAEGERILAGRDPA